MLASMAKRVSQINGKVSGKFVKRVKHVQRVQHVPQAPYSTLYDKVNLASEEADLRQSKRKDYMRQFGLPIPELSDHYTDRGQSTPKLEQYSKSFHSMSDENLQQALDQIDYKLQFLRRAQLPCDERGHQNLKTWMNWLQLKRTVLISLDLEVFELKQGLPLEVGLSIIDFRNQKNTMFPNFLNLHFIIDEHHSKNNSKYVPNNKTRFINGTSYRIKQAAFAEIFEQILGHYGYQEIVEANKLNNSEEPYGFDNPPPLAFVGHYFSADVGFLSKCFNMQLDSAIPIIDTYTIFKTTFEESLFGRARLGNLLRKVNIPGLYLHNGANDAYYTLILMFKLLDPELRLNLYCNDYEMFYSYRNWQRLNAKLDGLLDEPATSSLAKYRSDSESASELKVEAKTTDGKVEMAATLEINQNDSLSDPANSPSLLPEESYILLRLLEIKEKSETDKVFRNHPLVRNKNLITENYSFNIYDDELDAIAEAAQKKPSRRNRGALYPPNNELLGHMNLSKTEVLLKLNEYWTNGK